MLTRKCQWILMALLAACLATPAQTWALGLDELDVTSALNERFVGTIELLDAQGLQTSEIVVSMASREDFERVGVERFFYLTNLKFSVEMVNGSALVKVSSTQPIAEPYLNFIVEVLWPRGRLLKEYTVLLDPPTFSQAPAPAVQAPAQNIARPAPQQSTPGTRVDLQPGTPARRPAQRAPGDGLMTTRADTLWKIASRTLPSDQVSVNQHMLAIQRKNPNAFLRGNINLLKAGYVLDIPTESESLDLASNAATQEVAAQTQAWRSGDTTEQIASNMSTANDEEPQLRSAVDATQGGTQTSTSANQGQGQVRIVASTGELASGTASGDDPTVNVLLEENDTLARQVDELSYKLDREAEIATNQITVKDRQLEVKDQELAEMAERLRALEAQAAQAPQNQNQSPNPTSPDTPWWMSPMMLFGVIGLLILILVVVLIRLRNARAEQDAYENEFYEDEAAADADTFEDVDDTAEANTQTDQYLDDAAASAAVEPFIGEVEDASDEYLTTDDDQITSEEESAEDLDDDTQISDDPENEPGKTGDVIGEAEIYIAYGRYGQAANLLTSVLSSEPERWDVRLKLLEVFVESHDEAAFAEQAQYVLDHCDDEEVLMACRDLEAQFDSSHVDLSTDDASGDTAAVIADEASNDNDGIDLDLEDLELPTGASAAGAGFTDLSEETLEEELTLDDSTLAGVETDTDSEFELEFDDVTETIAEADSSSDELGGDLGIDFDPDREPLGESAAAASDDVELDLPTLDEATDASSSDQGADEFEFDNPESGDINATKLDLAEAYIDMGDGDGAQDILKEVLDEGSPEQKQKAQSMLDSLNG